MRVTGEPIVTVLGGINVDLVVSGADLPRPGETVTGGTFAQHQGGKGGNQAVAARRALSLRYKRIFVRPGDPRAGVFLLGAVGEDQLGTSAIEALRRFEDVQTEHVIVTSGAPTGVALIAVGPDGENQISVAPGANLALEADHVLGALETLQPHLLLLSLEIPERAVRAAIEWSHDHATPAIVNPAPFQPWVRDLLPFATYVTPNEHELEALGDVPDDVVVIETRGAQGVRIHGRGTTDDVSPPEVAVVDTTGAGDCFNGVLAARLAERRTLEDAVADAVVAAALSVTVAGAREGMPTRSQIEAAREQT